MSRLSIASILQSSMYSRIIAAEMSGNCKELETIVDNLRQQSDTLHDALRFEFLARALSCLRRKGEARKVLLDQVLPILDDSSVQVSTSVFNSCLDGAFSRTMSDVDVELQDRLSRCAMELVTAVGIIRRRTAGTSVVRGMAVKGLLASSADLVKCAYSLRLDIASLSNEAISQELQEFGEQFTLGYISSNWLAAAALLSSTTDAMTKEKILSWRNCFSFSAARPEPLLLQ